jgi:choline dehydrogenase-like flavoprotein
LKDYYPEDDEIGGYHHLERTRMHSDKKFGVVDANLKIHGLKNLYVSGSSVYHWRTQQSYFADSATFFKIS